MGLAKRTNSTITIALILFGITCALVAPGLPIGRAATASGVAGQTTSSSEADSLRQAQLEKLYAGLKAGDPFSEEERILLGKFGAGVKLTDLEADVVISRALFDYYIANNELTKAQQELLERYSNSVARRSTDIADLKTQLVNKRIAAAAAAPPRNTPLVIPPNDQCAGAEVIPAGGPFPYSTAITADITDATTTGDPPLPSCQTNVSRSIWYKFNPSATGRYTISTCAFDLTSTTVDDTVMAIYTSAAGCTGPFTEIPTGGASDGCDDDFCVSEALQAVITTQLNSGTQYYIVVWQFDIPAPTAGNTAVQLNISQVLPPANDSCATPAVLLLNTPVNGSTAIALNDYQLSGASCFTGVGQTASTASGGDVVYSFTAPVAGNYSFKVTNYDAVLNLVLYVASTCPAGAPPATVSSCLAASNRRSSSSSEEVSCLALANGQQVFVFVDENSVTSGSSFTIEVNRCTSETEPNDTPATANALAFGIEGAINPGTDADFYSIGAPAAGSRLFALLDGVAANSPDFDMRVTTTTDTLEYDDSNTDEPFGGTSPTVAGTPLTGAPSFIRVDRNSLSVIAAEPYRLYAVVQPPIASATSETEPNDTTVQANSAANNYFSGSLAGSAPSTDVDIYAFTATVGDLIFLSLDGDPLRNATPVNGALALLDSAGKGLISVNDFTGVSSTTSGTGSLTSPTPNSPAESLVWRAKTTGTYYAQVFIGTSSPSPSGAGDYLLSISKTGPTAAKFGNDGASAAATATRYYDGVSVSWRTGFEVDNLGFNVYRDQNGKRVRVNSQLIAGSALFVGSGVSLDAGKSYSWFDNSPASPNTKYFIEAIDLNGESTWHGPVDANSASVTAGAFEQASSPTLGQLGKSSLSEIQTTTLVDRSASIHTIGASGLSIQGDIDGQAPAVKLTVKSEGFYRVTQPELVAAGFNANVDPRNLRLIADGQEIPINVMGKGAFDSSSAIEFYGVGVDSATTDEHVYWLTGGSKAGRRIPSISAPGGPGGVRSFLSTVELRQRTVYVAGLRNGDKENFFGAVVARDPVSQALTLNHVDTTSANGAMLEVALQGLTLAGHRVEAQINGARAGDVVFNGQDSGVARLPVAQSLLREGANVVRLVTLGESSDVSIVDYIRVTYWRTFVADNDLLRLNASPKQAVTVDGLSSSAIRAFDVTNPNAPQELLGSIMPTKGGYSVTFGAKGSGLRTLVAMTDDTARRAANITLDRQSKWRQPGNAANFVILTRNEFMMALAPLKALRQSQGYKVAVVDIEDVYDEFSYGEKTPKAIKDFLSYARSNWKVAPRFVMLAGDASFDPKNYLGFGANDLAPTRLIDTQLMETASDDWLADFDGDGLADMAVGRLPIRSAREAATVVAKIIEYDRAARSEGVLLVADDSLDGVNFEAAAAELRGVILADQPVEQINRNGLDPATARNLVLDAINRGQKVINYSGHGNANAWRAGLLTADDANSLSNGDRLSLFVMMTCLNGYFHDAQMDSLAESLLLAEKGGAVAVWASTGMTSPADQGVMDIEMLRRLFDAGPNRLTLGEITMQAKAKALNKDVRLTWILFGDPTTRIR